MSTKNGRRYMMNRSLNEILKSIKLHYKLSLSRIIFSFPIVYKQNDPWPILSFTFSHNRLLMDFSQEKWILRDLLMMLSSTNISFIFQPGQYTSPICKLPFGKGTTRSMKLARKNPSNSDRLRKKLRVNARPWNTGENWKI